MIFLYAMFAIISFIVAKIEYKPLKIEKERTILSFIKGGQLSLFSIILLGLFAVVINMYYTHITMNQMASDRLNYEYDFSRDLIAATAGLTYIFNIVNKHGGNFEDVLYLTTFVSIVGFLLSYKISKISTPLGLLFCFCTPCLLTSFIALKQTYANAFASVAIVLMMRNKSWGNELLILLFLWLACQFHPVAFLMIPIYILFRFFINDEKKYNLSSVLIVVLLVMVCLGGLLTVIAKLIAPVLPYLASKLLQYFEGGEDQTAESGWIVMIKGIYIYYISYYLMKYRHYIQSNMRFYNQMLILSLIISVCYLISPFYYWLPRTSSLLEFPLLLYWVKCLQFLPKGEQMKYVSLFLIGFFTFRTLMIIFIK